MPVAKHTLKQKDNNGLEYEDDDIKIEVTYRDGCVLGDITVHYQNLHYVLTNRIHAQAHFNTKIDALEALRTCFMMDLVGIPDQWEIYSDDDWKELQRGPHEVFVFHLVADEDYYLLWADSSKGDGVFTLSIQHLYGTVENVYIFMCSTGRYIFTYDALVDALTDGDLTIDRPA